MRKRQRKVNKERKKDRGRGKKGKKTERKQKKLRNRERKMIRKNEKRDILPIFLLKQETWPMKMKQLTAQIKRT